MVSVRIRAVALVVLVAFLLRPGRPSDLPFVVDSWVKRGGLPNERLGAATARVRGILASPDSILRVAHVPDDDDAILGWACLGAEGPHYVYVRKDARRQGIATALLS